MTENHAEMPDGFVWPSLEDEDLEGRVFANLSREEQQVVARYCNFTQCPSGHVVLEEGAHNDALYIVLDGVIRIVDSSGPIREIGPGGYFGEMAMFNGRTRLASAVSRGACRLATMSADSFKELMSADNSLGLVLLRDMSATLSKKLMEIYEKQGNCIEGL